MESTSWEYTIEDENVLGRVRWRSGRFYVWEWANPPGYCGTNGKYSLHCEYGLVGENVWDEMPTVEQIRSAIALYRLA